MTVREITAPEPMTIDLERLRRAVFLTAEPVSTGSWYVQSGTRTYFVRCESDGAGSVQWMCDCPDHRIRGMVCKHTLAVLLSLGDERALLGLRALVARLTLDAMPPSLNRASDRDFPIPT